MSAVLDVASGRTLALKQLAPDASATVRNLFEREYHTLTSINHPGIIRVYDYGTDAAGAFYTMELLTGSDLSLSAPIPWRRACACLRDAADILGILHARGLVHRDLSPRNLWLTSEGRLKLIDFGALAEFGRCSTLVGTMPFVAPEAVRGEALDQRSDLFALGALGYWLITGKHAFRAQSFPELQSLHTQTPLRASQHMASLSADDSEPLPAALDDLLSVLLKRDPADRPQHVGELIDRLNAIAELEPVASAASAQGYVDSKAFVGRDAERAAVQAVLRDLPDASTRPKTVCIEADAGLGRSRLLHELVVLSRLSGVTTLDADASIPDAPFALAAKLAVMLLDALPVARAAANPLATVLAAASPELAQRLGRAEPATNTVPPDGNTILDAFRQLILSVSRERALGIFIDDVHAIDVRSQALLASLALEDAPTKLLLVVTLQRELRTTPSPALTSLRQATLMLPLSPLKEYEVLELLRSVFGSVPYLERLAQRVLQTSLGNCAHCLEIAEFLIRTGIAAYAEGAWNLPADLDPASLPTERDMYIGRIGQLPAAARALARVLSIPHWGPLTFEHCRALAEQDATSTRALLTTLCEAKLLRESPAGFAFIRDEVRQVLRDSLPMELAVRAHDRLAESISQTAGGDHRTLLLASVHRLYATRLDDGLQLLLEATAHYERRTITNELRAIIPMVEAAYLQLKRLGADPRKLGLPLTLLAVAGYYVDRRYGRYAEEALTVGQQRLRLDVFYRLRSYTGDKVALIAALACGEVQALTQTRVLAASRAVTMLIGTAAALNAMAATAADAATAYRYAEVIAPFAALGSGHVANFSYAFASFLTRQIGDRIGAHYRDARALRARLTAARPLRGMVPALKHSYLAGIDVVLCLQENWRESPAVLKIAEDFEAYSPLHHLYADANRWRYYLRHAQPDRVEFYRHRIELHAVKLESAWQVETWGGAMESINLSLQTHDAVRMKRAGQDLARMSAELPSLRYLLRRARGHYCVLRGNYARGIALLDAGEEPLAFCGWAQTRGMLARAHNQLGEHARAREICADAIQRMSPEDFDFVVLNLGVQIELALAEAGLGNFSGAAQQLETLFQLHSGRRGPLTLGALHDARAQVALAAGELELCRMHIAKMSQFYRPTGLATLRELVEQRERSLAMMEAGRGGRFEKLFRASTGEPLLERAHRAVQLAVELAGAASGFIVLADNEGALPHVGPDLPSPAQIAKARNWLRNAGEHDDDTTEIMSMDDAAESRSAPDDECLHYSFSRLVARVEDRTEVVAVLVLADRRARPQPLAAEFLGAITEAVAPKR